MSNARNNIERLIVRSLDGEITDDEQLTLNRELIRNPEAQRLMEEYKRIDELTAAALGQVMSVDSLPVDPELLPDRRAMQPMNRHHRYWWLPVGAVAAALLAVVTAPLTAPVERDTVADKPMRPIPQVPQQIEPQDGLMRYTGMNAKPRIKRSAGKDVFGVMGDDGNIYWIEVDRIWTLKRAQPDGVAGVSDNQL